MFFSPLTLRSSSSCCFSLSFWKSPRAFAFSLSLENSLQKVEPEIEGDSRETGERAVERKNGENKSENRDEANHTTMLWENEEGWKRARNSTEGQPAEGRKVKFRWQKRELCQGVKGLVCTERPKNILSVLHLLPQLHSFEFKSVFNVHQTWKQTPTVVWVRVISLKIKLI